jgi:hypothetical protein
MRDMKTSPYSTEEKRVVDFLVDALEENFIGGGDDPIGFMLVSWRGAVLLQEAQRTEIGKLRAALRDNGLRWGYTNAQIDTLLSSLSNEALDESRRTSG